MRKHERGEKRTLKREGLKSMWVKKHERGEKRTLKREGLKSMWVKKHEREKNKRWGRGKHDINKGERGGGEGGQREFERGREWYTQEWYRESMGERKHERGRHKIQVTQKNSKRKREIKREREINREIN